MPRNWSPVRGQSIKDSQEKSEIKNKRKYTKKISLDNTKICKEPDPCIIKELMRVSRKKVVRTKEEILRNKEHAREIFLRNQALRKGGDKIK